MTHLESFRQSVWQGSVPLSIRLAEDEPGLRELADACYYIQASRLSYLPLLLDEIVQHFQLCSNSTSTLLDKEQLWFQVKDDPVRWHWSIGLLYDYYKANYDVSKGSDPLEVTLHVRHPPTDKLLVGSSIEACRANFMNMVKEADYVRWKSIRRVTALRKVDQDALWEGLIQADYEKYWSVASKLVPAPAPPQTPTLSAAGSTAMDRSTSATSSNTPSSLVSDARLPEANSMRSVPLRIYIAGLPVLQDVVQPVDATLGKPQNLLSVLRAQLPALFPASSNSRQLASAVVQGVSVPLEAEIGFLASTLVSPDGWVHLVIKLT